MSKYISNIAFAKALADDKKIIISQFWDKVTLNL
jgi:hypothetical protein